MLDKIINDLGANYNSKDEEVLEDILNEVSSIASNISNRNVDDEKLYPYIKKAVKAIYLCRGAEGIQSTSVSGVSSSFEDIIDKMRNDIVKNGLRRMK
jgi:hypothetical protein